MKTIFICIACLFCICSYSQTAKDTIYFMNGTKVIGKLKKIKVGIVTFDPDEANDITVKLPKVRTIAAVRKIYRVETINNNVYFGKLLPGSNPNQSYVVNNNDSVSVYLEEISVLYPFGNSFWGRLSGYVSAGFSYTKSSGFGRLNFDASVVYSSKNIELSFSPSGIYTVTDSSFSRDREDISLKSNYYFKKNWFATVSLGYQRNLELGLDTRYQEGFGIGNKFITSKNLYGWGRSGLVFNQEKSLEDVNSGNLVEAFAQFEMNLFHFSKPDINLLVDEAFYYSLSQKGRFRNDAELSTKWKIFKDFYLDMNIYSNFDSQPPVSENNKFDYGIVFGINYTFN